MNKDVNLPNELASIRINTPHDLADAQALASHLLDRKGARIVFRLSQMSFDLLTAVLMSNAYTQENKTLDNVLFFLTDPDWDNKIQIIYSFAHEKEPWQQPDAAAWRAEFIEELSTYTHEMAADLIDNCTMHWHGAFILAKHEPIVISKSSGETFATAEYTAIPLIPKALEIPKSTIQIFKIRAVADAFNTFYGMKEDRRGNAGLILEKAQDEDGFRTIPDAAAAIKKLEQAKIKFENLAAPIDRLQLDLVLAAAMPAQDFRITPILLLGEPGIGKTYLAMQLARALGVKSEKISAGGGNASFQFTGSHPTWMGSCPGSIIKLLASSKSASPVLVIDEVDKLSNNSQYPVTPLLLDLLEPNTANKFKDQFLNLEFDASRLICILTANTLDGIPPALLSRVDVFHIPRPGREQRRRIIQQAHADLCTKSEKDIMLEPGGCELLANRVDLDIRKLTRLVREAFARALRDKNLLAELVVPMLETPAAESQETDVGCAPEGKTWKFH